VNDAIPILFGTYALNWPIGLPLSGHHMLDCKLSSRYTLITKPFLSIFPAS